MIKHILRLAVVAALFVAVRAYAAGKTAGVLNESNTTCSKIFVCDTPKVLSYTWKVDAEGESSYSWYTWAWWSFGGDFSVDGCWIRTMYVRADKNYFITNWTDSVSVDGKIYLSAGTHEVEWECWKIGVWQEVGWQITIEYELSNLPTCNTLYDWAKTVSDDKVYLAGKLDGVIANYDANITSSPSDYESRIYRALAIIAKLGENQTIKELIGEFGGVPDEFMQYIGGEFLGLDNIPQPNPCVDTASGEVLTAIDSALADLNAIPENWSGNIKLSTDKYEMLAEDVYLDNAELMLLRSTLYAARATANMVKGYDFSVDYNTVSNAYGSGVSRFAMIDQMPEVGKVRDVSKMALAKEDFRSALQFFKKADEVIVARTDNLTHFVEYDRADAQDIIEARVILDKALASLDNVVEVDGSYFANKYFSEYDLPNGYIRQVYLGALFAGQVTRDCIGRVIDESEFEDYEYLEEPTDVLRLVPDPTFGGVAPDVTISEVVTVYSDSQYFNISDYIALSPELELKLGNRLVVEGVATKNGNVEFNTATTGLVVCYVNGNRVLEFNPWMAESTSDFSFPVAAGDRYAVDLMPVSMNWPVLEITEPTKLIDFTYVPSPLPDGGSYFETVNGVEWAFEVKDGKAIVGTDEYTAIDTATSGAVAIPATLGSRPVAEIADGAFAWCKNITSLIMPATIEKIGDDPFYKCNSLAAITFYGNKPSYVHDDAFSHLLSECIFHVTRATNWDGVTIPGTWKGHNIDYVAGYNPAVTVASSVADGTRFDESQSIELTCGENETIYYTTDGTNPLTSPTRVTYSSPLNITETTTLTYCSVDNVTGDWSEIKTANYELIVRMPVGGPYTEVVNGVPWQFYVVEASTTGLVPYYSGASLRGIDTANYPDFILNGNVRIPSVLGEHPLVEISEFMLPMNYAIKKITIPDSVKYISSMMGASLAMPDSWTMQYPSWCDTTTYPGFVAIDGWIVARDSRVMELSGTVNLESARGIADGVVIADSTTTAVILPNTLEKITMSLGLANATSLRTLKIPDSVMRIEMNALPIWDHSMYDTEVFPELCSVDGWIRDSLDGHIVYDNYSEYIDLSVARGVVDGCDIWTARMKTLILPSRIKSIGNNWDATTGFRIQYNNYLENIYIPEGVTNIGASAIMKCPNLKKLYLPRSAENTQFQDWLTGLETLYLPDSMKARLETWDDTLAMRPIDWIQSANPSAPIEVIYYSTDRYQHTINFDANGGSVSEPVRKVNRGDLIGYLPVPIKAGYSFAGWTLDAAGKKAFDATKIVITDFTLYAQWESAYKGTLTADGKFALTEMAEEPVGAVVLPSTIEGRSVCVLGRDLMRGKGKVTSVAVPNTVATIESSAFRECTRLESVELPEGLTSIGDNAFRECVSLRNITIPSTVTNVGYFAFRDCLRLENVTLAGNPPRYDLGVFMGVPAFTTISGRLGAATAIIYAGITNATDDITVPEAWLDEIATQFATSTGSDAYLDAFEEKFGSDFQAALTKPTGKVDLHGNPLYVWQDYVAGTNPLDEEDKFTATITLEDGVPVVKWEPELPEGKAEKRKYTTLGTTTLGGSWDDVSDLTPAERQAAGYQFFQVTVEMKK